MWGIPAAIAAVALVAALLWWRRRNGRPLCVLTLREGQALGLEFPIRTAAATIGSQEGQTVVISHPKVSREHAVLSQEDGHFVLRDRSHHGTRVNSEPVKEAVLRSGDLIRLGESVDLIFTCHG